MEIFIAAKNSSIAAKVTDHRTDPAKIVIKAKHPEVGSVLAIAAGVNPAEIETTKGSVYFLTFLPRAAFVAGFGKAMSDVLAGNIAIATCAAVPR